MHIHTATIPRKLSTWDGIGASAHLVQASSLLTAGLRVDYAAVILVLAGRKTVDGGGWSCSAQAGELMLLPAGLTCDVTNQAAHDGPYEALALMFDDALLQEAKAASQAYAPLARAQHLAQPAPDCRAAILRAAELLRERRLPFAIVRHAAMEVLTWLALAGVAFAPVVQVAFVDRVRLLVARAPADDWSAAVAAQCLHVSVSTLRRRLAGAGWTMGSLLLEVRLAYALTLLQSSADDVGRIALDSGFRNHAHFSRLFKARFGITPSGLRQDPANTARDSTAFARHRTAPAPGQSYNQDSHLPLES